MTTPKPPADNDGFSDSDQQWFDRLGGKLTEVTDPAAIRQADAVRRAIELHREAVERDPAIAAVDNPVEHERRWQQLQFRQRAQRPAATPWWRRRIAGASAGLAAAALVAVVLLPRLQVDSRVYYDEPPVLRGVGPSRVTKRDAHPKQAADALAATLKQQGLQPGQYQHGKTFVVDYDVAPEQLPGVAPALTAAGLPAVAGLTRVEFAPE